MATPLNRLTAMQYEDRFRFHNGRQTVGNHHQRRVFPHRRKRLAGWLRLVLDIAACLAVAGLVGFAAGVLQAKGWPL